VTVAKREQSTAWELRKAWTSRQDVRLTLSPRCMLRTIVGRVSYVSVTGAFVVVDGWHIPCIDIDATGKPTIPDREGYEKTMDGLRLGSLPA
jgi:hypothetical protein